MKDKLYKLKEEAKPYFSEESYRNSKLTEVDWRRIGASKEALEEVNQKIAVFINIGQALIGKVGANRPKWTEEERQDIERLLNLGGFEGFNDLAWEWENYNEDLEERKGVKIDFIDYLKEEGK